MGYQALLFCPDEKAARGVTQVLSELDFSVEPCTEPFAAVKKLMAQHFDAIVVDCDNEQNATLLFKSARNSSANQSSLAVAVVEGQAGVAKAFRIGANLVLTKPINIEQAKGTLRVARGLLRKGADAPKPGTDTAMPAPSVSAPAANTPKATPSTPRPAPSAATPAGASSKAWPTPAKAVAQPPVPQTDDRAGSGGQTAVALDAPSKATTKPAPATAQEPAAQKKYPWQASKPAGQPMAPALKKPAESAKIAIPEEIGASAVTAAGETTTVSHGAAAAPAPAREKVSVPAPFLAPTSNTRTPLEVGPPARSEPPAVQERSFAEPEINPPSFSMGAPAVDEEEPGNSKKALLIVAAVVVLASLAGYLGWRNMSGKTPAAATAPQGQTSAESSAQLASSGTVTTSTSAGTSAVAQPNPPNSAEGTSTPSPAKPSTKMVAKDSFTSIATPAPQPAAPPAASALVVHHETSRPAPKQTASEPDAAPAPSAVGLTPNADPHALALIGNAPVAVPKATDQVVKVSQGVSEGLILKKVQPRYPSQAIQMRMEGAVQLQATIGKDGSISNVKALSGDAMLSRAAQDAVKQWKYKPYYLNGEPVEIQTQITVNFKLPK
jgi:periplasmic protein TonB